MTTCTVPQLTTLKWYEDSDERAANGERQQWCITCQRWIWEAQLCAQAQVDEQLTAQMQVEDVLG